MAVAKWFRAKSMRTQLLLSFGLMVTLVIGAFIGIWAGSVFWLKDTLIRDSKRFLVEQISLIAFRFISEVKDVLLAKVDMSAASFLYPVAFGLFDAYDPKQEMSVLPLTSHAGARMAGCRSVNQTICLRPPIRQDPRAGQTFRCKDPASISRAERNTDDQSYDRALAEAWKCCKNPTISEMSGTSFMNECPRHGASVCESASCWWTSGGCDCSGRKWLSLTASSVFVTGMDDTTAEAKAKMKIFDACRCFDSDLNVTSFMDAFVDSAWRNNPAGIQVYVGISNDNTGPGMFRAYPGSVREKLPQSFENEGTEGRLYNVGVRPWFESAKASIHQTGTRTFMGGRQDQLQAKRPPVSLTAPYKDADGKGDLVTLSAPIIIYDAASPAGKFKGVVGLDLVVEELRALVNSIRLRETGEAVVFHKTARLVLASPQLTTDKTIAGALPKIDDLSWLSGHPKKFGDLKDTDFPCAPDQTELSVRVGSGDEEVVMVSGSLWQGEYCGVLVTRVQEIEQPIMAQLAKIDKQAMALFLPPIFIAAACGAVLLAIVFMLARCMSRPLESTARDSNEIVKNIGGDLSKVEQSGGEDDLVMKHLACLGTQGEVGEVSDLRLRFDHLLVELLQKRQKSVGHVNPVAQGSAHEELKGAVLRQGVRPLPVGEKLPAISSNDVVVNILTHTQSGNLIRPVFNTRATRWNVMAMQLRLWLILPLSVILIVIVTCSAVTLSQRTTTWVAPVQAKMIEEEIQSLDLRVRQRAAALSETLVAGTNTINMVKHYWLRLLDGQSKWRSADDVEPLVSRPGVANPSYFSPVGACPSPMPEGVECKVPQKTLETEELPAGKTSIASREARLLSVQSTSFFRPKDALPKRLNPVAPDTVFSYQSEREEVEGLADLDNVLRVAFFSADVTSVYVAFHSSQTFKMFPYEKLSSYVREKVCDSVMDKPDDFWDNTGVKKPSFYKNVKSSHYNPTCRPWYQRAQRSSPLPPTVKGAPRGDVVFNPIDFDAGTGLPYLSFSSAVWRGSGEKDLVGVVSMDLNLASINDTLSRTDLYKRGYVLVWDDNGMTVVHKSLKAGLPRYDIAWVDATSGGRDDVDEEWMVAQEQGMFAKGRVAGNFNFTYRGEIWFYTFMPVPNTPYMIALSVVYPEVTETADNLAGQLQELVRNAVIIICAVLGLACACLIWFSDWFNRNIGKPVAKLADYVGQLKETHYAQDLPMEEPGSAELEEISRNMERMLVALRFGDSRFSRGNKGLELQNCIEALGLILELGQTRGRGVCMNNMANCLSALQILGKKKPSPAAAAALSLSSYPKLLPAMQAVKQLHAAQPEVQEAIRQFDSNPLDPDIYFQLAVIEASPSALALESSTPTGPFASSAPSLLPIEPGQTMATLPERKESCTEQQTWQAEPNRLAPTPPIGSNNPTLAFRLLNRTLHFLNLMRVDEVHLNKVRAQELIESAARVASGEPGTLATMAWSVCKNLNEALLQPKYAGIVTVLKGMCVRAQALLAEVEGASGVPEETANTCAELCGVLCLFDEPEQQVARAWAALSSVPRMKPDLMVSFLWYLKHHKPALVQPIDAAFSTALATYGYSLAGLEREATVWRAVAVSSPVLTIKKDVFFCLDISGSMSWKVGNGNTRLRECQTALQKLLGADILSYGDRIGLKQFDAKCDTLLPITDVSDESLTLLRDKVHALTTRGGTKFFRAIQSCLRDLQAGGTNEQWIIALTDGETHWQSDEETSHSSIKNELGRSKMPGLKLVTIIVGPNTQGHLIDELAASCHESNKVIPLRVGTDDIAAAFAEVQEILSGGGLSEDL